MTALPPRTPVSDADWLLAPSPCVGVCRYHGPRERCVACAMAREDKRRFKRLDAAAPRRRFFERTVRRLARQGGLMRWLAMYAEKCRKNGRTDVTRGL